METSVFLAVLFGLLFVAQLFMVRNYQKDIKDYISCITKQNTVVIDLEPYKSLYQKYFCSSEIYSKEQIAWIKNWKRHFQYYFEGASTMDWDYIEPPAINPILISNFGISFFHFDFSESVPTVPKVYILLSRPGILIGKGGDTIDGLKKYLTEEMGEFKIEIVEFNPFDTK